MQTSLGPDHVGYELVCGCRDGVAERNPGQQTEPARRDRQAGVRQLQGHHRAHQLGLQGNITVLVLARCGRDRAASHPSEEELMFHLRVEIIVDIIESHPPSIVVGVD